MASVVRDWVQTASFKQQTVLLSALRGCDGTRKEDPSKPVVRWLRSVTLKSAIDIEDNGDTPPTFDADPTMFMANQLTAAQVKTFIEDLDPYPTHWVWHLAHGLRVIALHHPDEQVATDAAGIWLSIHQAVHVEIEHTAHFEDRLADAPGRNPTEVRTF